MEQKSVKFSEYNPQTDNWDNYIDRLKYCFEANGVFHDTAKRANFFTVCGAQVFETFLALITPRKSSEVTFSEIEAVLTKHYSPKPNEISMSYKFYKCDQKPNQTAAEYIAQLRKLSSGCNFADLERMLRDRLVCGMTDHKLQYELLQKEKLNYTFVVDAMLSTESAVRDVRMILGCENSVPGSSNIINTSPEISAPEPMDLNTLQSKSNTRFCYRCGERHGGECRFINVICHFCKKKGHIEKVCMVKKKNKSNNVNYTDKGSDFLLNGIYNVGDIKKRIPAYMVKILLEGQSVVMQIDCGAGFSLLNEHTWRSLRAAGSHAVLHSTHDDLHTWTLSPVHFVHTKALARSYVWWPQLNKDIETLVAGCVKCLENRHMPPKSTHEWITPRKPWSRINIDFAGPYQKRNFLIVVDAYSRWPEVFIINNTSTETVIRHLRNLFATHGLCETLVSDNGTPFVSQEMKTFLESNKIKHITTAPYHPATNGLAERMVQTIKDKLSKMEDLSWDVRIPNMLLGLRMTPCAGTHKSPAELLMNRRLRTLLDTIHPDNIQQRKTEKQVHANAVRKHREAALNQSIMYRNYGQGPRWLPGKVVRKEGPSSYIVETGNGAFVNRHIDQLVKRKEGENIGDKEEDMSVPNDPDVLDSIQDESNEEIIEVPSAEKWAEMLGIPESSVINVASGGGKHKTKFFSRSKPY